VIRSPVFLDTSAWLAALSTREHHHAKCVALYAEFVTTHTPLLTTSLVIAEMHGLLVRRRGAENGLMLLDLVRSDPLFEIVQVDADMESHAIDRWLRQHPKLPLSLADAVSFEAMRQHGIRVAFTLDRHFAKVGFKTKPS
jgi:predicted nucleic acid-binding protein